MNPQCIKVTLYLFKLEFIKLQLFADKKKQNHGLCTQSGEQRPPLLNDLNERFVDDGQVGIEDRTIRLPDDNTARGPPHTVDGEDSFTKMGRYSSQVTSPIPTAKTNPKRAALITHVPSPTEKSKHKLNILSFSACRRGIVGIGIEKIHKFAAMFVMLVK